MAHEQVLSKCLLMSEGMNESANQPTNGPGLHIHAKLQNGSPLLSPWSPQGFSHNFAHPTPILKHNRGRAEKEPVVVTSSGSESL